MIHDISPAQFLFGLVILGAVIFILPGLARLIAWWDTRRGR
jgi:hypothetical protein